MNSKKMFLVSLAAMIGIAGTGCSGGGDNKKPLDDVFADGGSKDDPAGYSKASCLHKYSEGPAALDLRGEQVAAKYFGKRIDMNLLNAVMTAGGAELVRAAENTGVRFYKTSTAKKADSCEYAASLPDAPYDVDRSFSDAGSGVLGLFLSKNTKGVSSTQTTAVIAVRKDVNKWVLIHEYMHHLFNKEVERSGLSSNDIKEKTIALLKEYETAKSDAKWASGASRKLKVNTAAAKLIELNAAVVEFLKQYLLEEMTIESILAEKLDAQELKLVLPAQRINGAAYTVVSAKKAKTFIDQFKTENSDFKSYFYEMDSSYRTAIDQSSANYAGLTTEMVTLSDRAMKLLREKGLDKRLDLSGLVGISAGGDQMHTGCSHDRDADEVLEKVLEINNQ